MFFLVLKRNLIESLVTKSNIHITHSEPLCNMLTTTFTINTVNLYLPAIINVGVDTLRCFCKAGAEHLHYE